MSVTLAELRRIEDMHAVYRMFDGEGRLLYVGMTGELRTRFADHAGKRWFPQVETITLKWYPTHAAARAAEQRAIWAERPRHNIAGAKARIAPRRPPVAVTLRQPGARVTLAEAVGAGMLPGLSLAGARTCRHRDTSFPKPVSQDGSAMLYDPDELAAWAAGRKE